jgi:hypothetical protein
VVLSVWRCHSPLDEFVAGTTASCCNTGELSNQQLLFTISLQSLAHTHTHRFVLNPHECTCGADAPVHSAQLLFAVSQSPPKN